MSNYGVFAQVYNELMDETVFFEWRDYVLEHLDSKSTILELGCGSGQLGILLKEQGFEMTGLDLSEDMLSYAQFYQDEMGIHFPLIQGDMRNLEELGEFEAIISFCDSLCYLPEKEDMKKTFTEAYQHLKKDGQFLFDVFTTEHMDTLDGYAYHDELPGIVFIWDSFPGEHPHSIEHDLSFFIEKEDGTYERQEELHKERTYPIETYRVMLKQAGFQKIEVTADFGEKITGKNTRWFFKAQK